MKKPFYLTLWLFAKSSLAATIKTGLWLVLFVVAGSIQVSGQNFSDVVVSGSMPVTCPPTTNIWYVNAAAADGGDGSSWDCAFNDLQDALTAASSGQEIWVAAGVYKPGDTRASSFVMKEGVAIYGGFPADGDPTAQDRDYTAYPTVLSGEIGSTAQNDNILSVVRGGAGLTTAAVLDGFIVEEGHSNNFPNRRYGGGLFLFASGSNAFTNPTIRNCIFRDNFANTGPAICVRVRNGSSSAPTFENCNFNNNTGTFGNSVWMSNNCSATFENCNFDNNTGNTGVNVQTGNTVFNNCSFTNNMANNFGAAIWARGNLTLNNCYFEKNSGPSNGALRLQQSNTYNISNCTFLDNTSNNNGGAIFARNCSPLIENCTFLDNTSGDNGGAMFALNCSPLIENCTFLDNHANGLGGAVFNDNTSGRFVNCTFRGNSAQRGGALFNNGNGSRVAEPTLINCLFDSNTANAQGGAMVNESNSGQDAVPTLINCTLYGNSAGNSGDALCNIAGGSAVLRNTILFSNGGSGAIFNNGATIVDATNSLFDAEVSGYSSAPTNYTSENSPFVDPANGNFELNDCAAAIDQGDNSIYTDAMGTPNDLAGEVRFFNASSTQEATIDMGAFEFEGTPAPFSINCQDVMVQLDASGQGTLEYSAFDNGSIGCAPLRFEVDGNTSLNYTCADIGSQTIMLTVTDDRQFTSSCNPSITISDDIAPMAACQDVTAQLDGSGSASVAASSIDNGSSDACGIQSLVLSQSEFDCFSIGDNNVTLTVTDNSGNSSTCSATVMVQDNNAPTAICANPTVNLASDGTTTVDASFFDGGSTAVCGELDFSASMTDFDCDDVGETYSVTLTVTSQSSGQSDHCTASVTVDDPNSFCCAPPMAVCENITVQLDANGQANITPADIGGGSTAECGLQSESLSVSTFGCADVGSSNAVTYTITDVNNDSDNCTATVSVEIGTALPAGWSATDVGQVTVGNAYSFDPCTATGGEFTVTGSGNNATSSTTDNVAFASQTLCGNGMITAKMESITPNGYAGLMIRETTAAGSKQVSIFSNLTNVLRHEARFSTNGPKQVQAHYRPFPFWLRLQRQGDWVFAYYSTTGSSFSYVHAVYVPMQSCVEIGLASFTYLPNAQTEAIFSNVTVSGGNPSMVQMPQNNSAAIAQAQPMAFPNPTSGQVQLQFPQGLDTEATVSLRSLTGQTLQQRQLQPGDAMTDWDLSTQPAGVYLLEIRQAGLPPVSLRVVKAE